MKVPCFDTNINVEYPLSERQTVVFSLSSRGSLEVGINNLSSKQCPGFLRLYAHTASWDVYTTEPDP